jgi:hypothetical protein
MIAMEAKKREQHSSSHYHSHPIIAIRLLKISRFMMVLNMCATIVYLPRYAFVVILSGHMKNDIEDIIN